MSRFVDRYGKPYISEESEPAGGGLDSRCSYNQEALHAYYELESYEKIKEYFEKEHFIPIDTDDINFQVWKKGDTLVTIESYIDGMYGYLYTTYEGDDETIYDSKNVVKTTEYKECGITITNNEKKYGYEVYGEDGCLYDESDFIYNNEEEAEEAAKVSINEETPYDDEKDEET